MHHVNVISVYQVGIVLYRGCEASCVILMVNVIYVVGYKNKASGSLSFVNAILLFKFNINIVCRGCMVHSACSSMGHVRQSIL